VSRTLYLLVAFDGTDFHGWQKQPGVRTVQEVLEDSLRRVLRHPVALFGCGRTDAGVHALGHVNSVATDCTLPVDKLLHAIGSRLPADVSLIAVREVHPAFHATLSATSKLYRYRIHHGPSRPVEHLAQRYAYHVWRPLDIDAMRAASRFFIGEMDFTSMAATGTVRRTMVRTVLRVDIEKHREEIRFDVEGKGFLHHQVRNMVGTMLNVGCGMWQPEYVRDILAGRDRSRAGPCVPAHGLCLMWVRYPPELLRPTERLVNDTAPLAV
jgi:tRNA pseudouridine38-40 synthase